MEADDSLVAVSTPSGVPSDEGANKHLPEFIGVNHVDDAVDDGLERTSELISKQSGRDSVRGSGNVPDSKHSGIEVELTRAQERIEMSQLDLARAEKKLAENQKEHLNEVSVLQHGFKSSVSSVQGKVKFLESEGARLLEERNALEGEASNLSMQLETAMHVRKELQSQVDGLTVTVNILEKNLSNLKQDAEATKANLLAEVEASRRELATKSEALESLHTVHSGFQRELQEVKSKNEDKESLLHEQICTLESMVKSAQDGAKSKESVASSLQAEIVNLKLELSRITSSAEERLEQLEVEHQEQLKVVKERCESLQNSTLELEGRNLLLQDTLGAARSDGELAKAKLAELELQLEMLIQAKSKSDEDAAEIESQIKSMKEMLSKQVDSLKLAEENADAANVKVIQLQDLLKTTEEMLRASEEAAVSLQQEVTILTSKETLSAEHLKLVEENSQKIQLQLQSKLGTLEATNSHLDEKITQLHDSLSAAIFDGDSARHKVSELETEMSNLRAIQGELEEKLKSYAEKCSQHEDAAQTSRMRGIQLEGLITEHKNEADDLKSKVVAMDAALMHSKDLVTDLQTQLRVAKDDCLLLGNASATSISNLEDSVKQYDVQVKELKQLLLEKTTENNILSNELIELKSSISALESDLEGVSQREMVLKEDRIFAEALNTKLEEERKDLALHLKEHKSLSEKGKIGLHEASVLEKKLRDEISLLEGSIFGLQGSLTQAEEEKQTTITQLESATKNFAALNDQLVKERQQVQRQVATLVQENEASTKKFDHAQEKLHAALEAAELSAKQVQEGTFKESTLNAQVEALSLELKKALDACAYTENLQQEKANLALEVGSVQERLHATLEAAEQSARQLEAASLKELELVAENADLKVQLRKAMDGCAQAERLEQVLPNSITREEHQTEVKQLPLANKEQQLLTSKSALKDSQQVVSKRETHVEAAESKAVEVFEQQLSREMEEVVRSPVQVRSRKKKGVTWQTDAVVTTPSLPSKSVHSLPPPAHHQLFVSHRSYVVHLLIALVSLTIGFWLARKVNSY